MRMLKASGKNFQSYKDIDFDYTDLGLTLLSGQTKAGKSTVLDLGCWTITGTTSKNSAADDVKSWFADGEATVGQVDLEVPTALGPSKMTVTRIRGIRSSQNDLYYQIEDEAPVRGKDANDTQKLIYGLLNVTADTLINGSYLHQFSKADQFFVSKAKDRRETLERIANLDLPVKLAESASEARKVTKVKLDKIAKTVAKSDGELNAVIEASKRNEYNRSEWASGHLVRVRKAEQAIADWESVKAQREASALKQIETWDASKDQRIQDAQTKVDGYETEKSERAYRITDQLAELDKIIVPQESFQKQQVQIKQQLKAIEFLEVELRDADRTLHVTKLNMEQLKGEYQGLDNLEGTCPTCLGPADNEHSAGRKAEIEVEIVDQADLKDSLEAQIKSLRAGVEQKSKLLDSIQLIFKKELQNKALIEKVEGLRNQVTVLRAEKNPYSSQLEKIQAENNPYLSQLHVIIAEKNPYIDQLSVIALEQNPFDSAGAQNQVEIDRLQIEFQRATKELNDLERELSGLNWLYDKSFELRGRLLEQSVRQLQDKTNQYLERFFDAELRVQFTLESSDKLDVTITNDGYNCPYGQLSGGERCLLKLAFGIPYMKAVEDKAGVKFNVLMLDEALNGLDPALKVKAFTLLQSLETSYETILLIDHHEEFQNMFSKKFLVTKTGAYSQIELQIED